MNKKIVAAFSTLIMACVSAIGCSLAWFYTPSSIVTNEVNGGLIKSYFHSGNGTQENPFIITRPVHLYNFIALQEELDEFSSHGFYFQFGTDLNNDDSPEFYKYNNDGSIVEGEYSTSLNMKYYSKEGLDPMGTVAHPFRSKFNGNGLTVSNLTIKGEGHMDVGIFGYVSDGTVTNLYFDSPTISTNGESTSAETADSTHVSHDETCCYNGYLVGHLKTASSFNNVYVNNCSLNGAPATGTIARNEYGYYGHVGDATMTTKKKIESMSGGGSSGGDEGYGTSIDVYELYNKLSTSLGSTSNPLTIPSNYAIPIKFDSSKTIVSGSGATTVTSSGTSISVSNGSTIPANNNATNIGYYSGSLGVYKDTYSSKDFSNISTATNSPISYNSLTDTEKQKIQDYLSKATTTGKNSDNAIELDGSSNFNGANQTRAKEFPTSSSAYTVIKNAKIGNTTKDALIPTNGIWVAPTKPGRFEFIASGTKVHTVVLIVRLQRSTAKDYSTGFTNTSYLVQFNNDWSTGMVGFAISGTNTVYYGLEITQSDIDAGYEYFITNDADMTGSIFGYPTIFYLDIGTDGSSSSDGDATINEDAPLFTNVDYRDSGATVTNSILNIQYDAAAGTSGFCIIVSYDSSKYLYTITITNESSDTLEFSVLLNDDDGDASTTFNYKYSIIYNTSAVVSGSQISKIYTLPPTTT